MKIFILPKFWVFLLCSILSSPLFATVFTVSTLAFTGAGSLNEVLIMANSMPGPHTINFGVTGTITATQLLPTITEDFTINGTDIVINGATSYQIFDIASSSTMVINGITITSASAVIGAAISNRGTLTLNEVTLSNNVATNRAGAIYNQGGDITINNSTINNNQGGADGGGGIYNTASGSMSINNSTFSGNFSFGSGGGIYNAGQMEICQSTIASNTAFASSNAGGGIYNSNNLTLCNNIVYNNTVGFFGTPEDMYSAGSINNTTNLVGICTGSCPTFASSSNPLLAPLADNGGPTQTMQLLAGSPAVDIGSTMCGKSTDQRGYTRDGTPDLGSYEVDASVPVELLSFTAEALANNTISLYWITASELDNEGFQLERSPDALQWNTIAFVKGAGTTSEPQYYKYNDKDPLYHSNYYRLKQLDKDGAYEYSHILEISLKSELELDLLLSPNPVRSVLHYQLIGEYDDSEAYRMLIFNILGKPVRDIFIQSDDIYHLPMDDLPNGSYFVLLKNTRDLLLKRNIVIVK